MFSPFLELVLKRSITTDGRARSAADHRQGETKKVAVLHAGGYFGDGGECQQHVTVSAAAGLGRAFKTCHIVFIFSQLLWAQK